MTAEVFSQIALRCHSTIQDHELTKERNKKESRNMYSIKKNIVLVCIIFATLFLVHCSDDKRDVTEIVHASDKQIAQKYCGTCHKFPDPELLPKELWKSTVLPRMGNMMGIYKDAEQRANLIAQDQKYATIYPEESIIEKEDWKKIERFYQSLAPNSLTVPDHQIELGLKSFEIVEPEFTISPPSSTLVKFMDDNTIALGDALSKKLIQFDTDLDYIKTGNMPEGLVHIEETNNAFWMTTMGSFSPSDNPKGLLLHLPKSENKQAQIIADQLRRPVHAAYGDLNNDGIIDIVISEFGKWTGRLSMLIGKGNLEYEQMTLANQTGATKSFLHDFDKDGLLDIIALFAQGNESITIFYNQGNNSFRREDILRFPPSYGSTSFDLFDLEQDGDLDIIYTAGDNADFKPTLRPYHGIYLFKNDGENNFSQERFLHLNGAYGAKIHDFDLDGDLDIASISFFPDYAKDAMESFVYFENIGDLQYKSSTFEHNARGRWIVMDTKDKDNDGDLDIIIGSLTFETIPDKGYVQRWIDGQLPFVVLENNTRN